MNASVDHHPLLSGRPYLCDGGLETTFVFREEIDLPCFAAFTLLKNSEGRKMLSRYYRSHAALAHWFETGFILESPTWRASPDWAARLGYTPEALARTNRDAISLMHELRAALETRSSPMLVSGCVGPRGDGYRPSTRMTPKEAESYHGPQLQTYREAGAEIATAMTINCIGEALGIARAAAALRFPVIVSFTVETDGRLPGGETLREAIETVDAAAETPPLYYMINCAHPLHLRGALRDPGPWRDRVRGLRANASSRSHAELDNSMDLDAGNPQEFGRQHRDLLLTELPHLNVFGGCCGTDERHVEAIARECLTACESVPSIA